MASIAKTRSNPITPAGARWDFRVPFYFAVASAAVALVVGDWIVAPAVFVLYLAWAYLPRGDTPPILALAFTHQWVQVMCGIFYHGITGRPLPAYEVDSYRTMVLIGLGAVVALFTGTWIGDTFLKKRIPWTLSSADRMLPLRGLIVAYVVATATQGTLFRFAWTVSGLTEGLLVLTFLRLGIVYLLLRRLVRPRMRWLPFTVLLGVEIILGFTGYFADFREVEVIAVLAVLETVRQFRFRQVVLLGVLGLLMVASALVWTSIKGEMRARWNTEAGFSESRTKRLESLAYLSADEVFDPEKITVNMDTMVERLWAIYYPSYALLRVPSTVPFENGAILKQAVRHVLMPRLFFPEKPNPPSDSEMVRKYSGVWVRGAESGTSIAFGYAIESYIDFGPVFMFLPPLIFGVLMGFAYRLLLVSMVNKEMAIAACSVSFWIALYLYERSWLHMLGLSGTILIYVGSFSMIVDRIVAAARVESRPLLIRSAVQSATPLPGSRRGPV